jgi:CHRD domain
MQNRGVTLLAFVGLIAVLSCGGSDDPTVTTGPNPNVVTFKATMTFAAAAAADVPAPTVQSTGSGTFTATLDTSTNIFTWDLTFTGLTSGVNVGHIHGPATTTQSAGTTINFGTAPGATFSVGQTTGVGHGAMLLNAGTTVTSAINGDSLKKLLFAGLTYANIHTTNNGGGEIRGQIARQ